MKYNMKAPVSRTQFNGTYIYNSKIQLNQRRVHMREDHTKHDDYWTIKTHDPNGRRHLSTKHETLEVDPRLSNPNNFGQTKDAKEVT